MGVITFSHPERSSNVTSAAADISESSMNGNVMRKYKLCHADLSAGEAAFKIAANLAVVGVWWSFCPPKSWR